MLRICFLNHLEASQEKEARDAAKELAEKKKSGQDDPMDLSFHIGGWHCMKRC